MERPQTVTLREHFFYVRVFNPFAPSNRLPRISSVYCKHENFKKRHYEQRMREIEHSTFTFLIFSLTGGLGPAATIFLKCLASLLATKWDQNYSAPMGWLCCRLSFSLLRSSIMCIRGACSSLHCFERQATIPIDLIAQESGLSCTLNLVFTNQYTYNLHFSNLTFSFCIFIVSEYYTFNYKNYKNIKIKIKINDYVRT